MGPWIPQYNPPACNVLLRPPPPQPNPLLVPGGNRELLAEEIADVVDDYFRIDREDRATQIGDYLTEGRIETQPEVSSTCFEPWRNDTVTHYDRLESTLQSMRRRASVRIIPDPGGYLVDVQVYKELEDVLRPEHDTAGAATFRYDTSLERYATPVPVGGYTEGWIPQGRDTALEQQMLAQIHERLIGPCQPGLFSLAPPAGNPKAAPTTLAQAPQVERPADSREPSAAAAPQENAQPTLVRAAKPVEQPAGAAMFAPPPSLGSPPMVSPTSGFGDPADVPPGLSFAGVEMLPPVEQEQGLLRGVDHPEASGEILLGEPADERTLRSFWGLVKADYRNFYTCRNAALLGLGIGLAAPVANTNLDRDFRDWWQDDVRDDFTDDFASVFKSFGEGRYLLPAWAGLTALHYWGPESPWLEGPGMWGERAMRAFIVGGPVLYFWQYALGAGRPTERPDSWRWTPFEDSNAVSGHAFLGAVTFVTAAQMVEQPVLKVGFYALSILPGWSRLNDDAHYLSQVGLGWWFGYLSVAAVSNTNLDARVQIIPMAMADGPGMGLAFKF